MVLSSLYVGSLLLLFAPLSLDHFLFNKVPFKNAIYCSSAKEKLGAGIPTWTKMESFKVYVKRGGTRGQCECPAGEVWDPWIWPFPALK